MIAVTGGLGFIGNELVRQLLEDGESVVIIDNKNRVAPDIDDILQKSIVEKVDIVDHDEVKKVFEQYQPEVVYHLAAIHFIPECNENPERTLRVNVEGTSSVLRAAKGNGVSRFIFASSGAVYSDIPGKLNENAPIAPVDIYGHTKLFGEQLCELHSNIQFQVVACRLFNNFGPRETNAHIIPEILNQLKAKENHLRLGNIAPVRDYIHTGDTAKAMRLLSKCGLPKSFTPVNLCTGAGHSVADLIKVIETLLDRPIQVDKDPNRYRKVDKMEQIGDESLLYELTNWRPNQDLKKGLSELLSYEKVK